MTDFKKMIREEALHEWSLISNQRLMRFKDKKPKRQQQVIKVEKKVHRRKEVRQENQLLQKYEKQSKQKAKISSKSRRPLPTLTSSVFRKNSDIPGTREFNLKQRRKRELFERQLAKRQREYEERIQYLRALADAKSERKEKLLAEAKRAKNLAREARQRKAILKAEAAKKAVENARQRKEDARLVIMLKMKEKEKKMCQKKESRQRELREKQLMQKYERIERYKRRIERAKVCTKSPGPALFCIRENLSSGKGAKWGKQTPLSDTEKQMLRSMDTPAPSDYANNLNIPLRGGGKFSKSSAPGVIELEMKRAGKIPGPKYDIVTAFKSHSRKPKRLHLINNNTCLFNNK
eukprot:g5223.t1